MNSVVPAAAELERRVVFLSLNAANGTIAKEVLAGAGVHAALCRTMEEFCATAASGAGALVLADDALAGANSRCLSDYLDRQPTWSDIPLIVLTTRRREPTASWRGIAELPWVSNAILLDRPMRTETLLQAIRVALRARDRQYQLRSFLAEREGLLTQRDTLLREVHHRVKNNLQMMQSLIRLTARQAPSDAQPPFVDLIGRVAAIGQLHNQLYASTNFRELDAAAYLSEIADQLESAFGSLERRARIVKRLEPMAVNLDTALPLGLITTELVTNALRYAFPPGSTGEINIALISRDSARELTISDNGIGLPATGRPSASTGLQLVQALAKQIGGTFALDSGRGVRGVLLFPSDPAARQPAP